MQTCFPARRLRRPSQGPAPQSQISKFTSFLLIGMHILIAGGGLGGLLLAHALVQHEKNQANSGNSKSSISPPAPLTFTVLERDPGSDARAQGLIIGIAQQGVDALVKAGLVDVCRQVFAKEGPSDVFLGSETGACLIRGEGWLRLSLPLENDAGSGKDFRSSLVDRAVLRKALGDALPEGSIRWNSRVTGYQESRENSKIFVTLEDGTQLEGDVLVAADGARSVIRNQLVPQVTPKGLGFWSVAGTVWLSEGDSEATNTIYTESCQSLVRLNGREGASLLLFTSGLSSQSTSTTKFTLWSLSAPLRHFEGCTSPDTPPSVSLERTLDLLRSCFDAPELVDLIAHTSLEKVGPCYEITSISPHDLLTSFPLADKDSLVTILGDAAHKTTTQAGLGATGAFLDALELANELCFSSEPFSPAVLRRYEAKMAKTDSRFVAASVGNTLRIHGEMSWAGRYVVQTIMWTVGCIMSAISSVRRLLWRGQ